MAESKRKSFPGQASCDEIVIQDCISLLNTVRAPGGPKLQILKTLREVPSNGSVFDVCRKPAPQWFCTFEVTKKVPKMQHRFRCQCKATSDVGLCTVCANACHKGVGHRLEYVGYKPFFCVCGAEKGEPSCMALAGKGVKDAQLCTFGKPVKNAQHYFNCVTCGLVGRERMCVGCVNICHNGHEVQYAKLSSSLVCSCGSSRNCKALNL